jgi:hypothetical protein
MGILEFDGKISRIAQRADSSQNNPTYDCEAFNLNRQPKLQKTATYGLRKEKTYKVT